VIIWNDESGISQISFYSGGTTLIKVGNDDDEVMRVGGGRVETFEIAGNEQLIGCELEHYTIGGDIFCGVTWIKMKISV
jgi:hypothetical protein